MWQINEWTSVLGASRVQNENFFAYLQMNERQMLNDPHYINNRHTPRFYSRLRAQDIIGGKSIFMRLAVS